MAAYTVFVDPGTVHLIEHQWKSTRKVRNLSDLLNIELSGSKPIKCVAEVPPFLPIPLLTDKVLKNAYILYRARLGSTLTDTPTWKNRLRWQIRLHLAKWGII